LCTDEGMAGKTELGHSSQWKLEEVVNWRRIVQIFYVYQGAATASTTTNKTSSSNPADEPKTTVEERSEIR
jgi:hypothetical protein